LRALSRFLCVSVGLLPDINMLTFRIIFAQKYVIHIKAYWEEIP